MVCTAVEAKALPAHAGGALRGFLRGAPRFNRRGAAAARYFVMFGVAGGIGVAARDWGEVAEA